MKKIKSDIRMLFAEILLNWSTKMAPKNKEGDKLRENVYTYFTNLEINGSK